MSNGTWSTTGQPGGVFQHFGQRGLGDDTGIIKTVGSTNELVLYLTGTNVTSGVLRATGVLPAGAKVTKAYSEVSEAFDLGGTTPTIDIGTQGTEGTNGFDLTEAQAEAIGTYEETTFTGTWLLRLAAQTVVDVALGGSTPTSLAGTGIAKVVIEYINV